MYTRLGNRTPHATNLFSLSTLVIGVGNDLAASLKGLDSTILLQEAVVAQSQRSGA